MSIQELLLSTGQGIASGISDQLNYGLGQITGLHDSLDRRQLEQQQALTDMQYNANMGLMKESFRQQFDMWNKTNYGAQVQHLKDAGLNPALLYAKGGAGGSTGSGTTSVGMGQASKANEMQTANSASTMAGMSLMKLNSEIELNKAQAEKLRAEAQTTDESRNFIVNKLEEEGHGLWLKNIQEQFKMGDTGNILHKNKTTGRTAWISDTSLFNDEITTSILKAQSEANNQYAQSLLNNEKAKGYLTELLNAMIHADADQVKAKAYKLATEWATGEYLNWKSAVSIGTDIFRSLLLIRP